MADPGFLGFIPRFAVGGVLFISGVRLLRRWIVQSVRQLSTLEYASLLAVVLIIVQWGFIAGVVIGVVIGCATFAVSASRVNAIKFGFDGSEYRSHLDRSGEELAILAQHGRELQGMSLQSYLFFGSANKLYQHVKALLQKQPNCRFLVFDFRLVTGLDSSATHSFSQIKQVASENGARLVLVNLTPDLQRTFQTIKFLSADVMVAPDLDRALELCEDAIIATHRAEGTEMDSLRVWLGQGARRRRLRRGARRALPPLRSAAGRHHRAPGRAVEFHALHPRWPRRHHGGHGRGAGRARAQPRPPHHHR